MTLRALIVGAVLCVAVVTGTAHADTVKLGFNVPLTGPAAGDGHSALNGAKLAVRQINADGGVNGNRLDLTVYDDRASAQEAATIAGRLIEKDRVPLAVSASYSAPTLAAAEIFEEAGIPYIAAYAVDPDITRVGDDVFRVSFVGEVEGRAGAKLIGDVLGKSRVVMVTLNNDFGRSLADGFKQAADRFGIEIVSEYEYGIGDRGFGSLVSKVTADAPEAIYASGYFFTAAPLVAKLRAAGIDASIIGQEGYDSESFIALAGPAAEGVLITTSLDRDSRLPATRDFIAGYEKMTGQKPDMVAASAHAAVRVAAEALRKADVSDPAALRAAIAESDVTTAVGRIRFNDLGEVRKDVQVQIVRDGDWHHFSVISDPELLAPPSK